MRLPSLILALLSKEHQIKNELGDLPHQQFFLVLELLENGLAV